MKALENEARAGIRNQSNNGSDKRSDSDAMLEKPSAGDISKEEAQVSLYTSFPTNFLPVLKSFSF